MGGKLRVGVLFGGRSGEHEVSLISARSVMAALDRDKYEVVPIGISREGTWIVSGDPLAALERQAGEPAGRRGLILGLDTADFPQVDLLFPVLHGPYGEDGTLQGLLEMAGLPYVGAGVLGSALAMDKALFKEVMRAHGLPIVPYLVLLRREWEQDPAAVLGRVEAALPYPLFTKPANLGSSVGVRKCPDRASLTEGLNEAARYDRKLLVEQAVPQAREIEVGVLGNDDPVASLPGEIIPSREFYSYEAKYLDEGEQASQLLIPAPLSLEMVERVQDLALRAYRAIDCAGMARADFLLAAESGELYISELNTIPGFTSISMYPKLWEASGLPYPRLLDRLIELALERFAERQRMQVTR